MRATDLLAQSHRLARATISRPRQVDLKRAVSTAYYALFHTLAKLCADTIAGAGAERSSSAWRQCYRALAHGTAKNACAQVRSRNFSVEVQRFAHLFVSTQEQRHSADYDPLSVFRRGDVVTIIEEAERAIAGLRTVPRPELRALVALVLLPEQSR